MSGHVSSVSTLGAEPPPAEPTVLAPLLEARGLACGYRGVSVVRDLEVEVNAGEVVVLLGPNGVGKTTTLLTLVGELPAVAGEVRWQGTPTRRSLDWRARRGLAFVPEERAVFTGLSALDNLRVGRGDIDFALGLFPELELHLAVKGGLLSGGQQQMLILARALSRRPKVVVADELSLGLAPLVVERLFRAIRDASKEGVGVLLVEQHVRKVLPFADRAYVMAKGRIVHAGTADEITDRLEEIESSYLTGSPADR
ncbi:MAG: transporter related protein [Acidimicrobiales bacterium]|nr:transporter related protein [Acidimicrobiales bacterium]